MKCPPIHSRDVVEAAPLNALAEQVVAIEPRGADAFAGCPAGVAAAAVGTVAEALAEVAAGVTAAATTAPEPPATPSSTVPPPPPRCRGHQPHRRYRLRRYHRRLSGRIGGLGKHEHAARIRATLARMAAAAVVAVIEGIHLHEPTRDPDARSELVQWLIQRLRFWPAEHSPTLVNDRNL